MKKLLIAKLFMIALVGVFVLNNLAMANDSIKTVKLKTSVSTMEGKEMIETITSLLKGVDEASLDSKSKELKVVYDPSVMSPFMLIYTVNKLGYDAEIIEDKENSEMEEEKTAESQ